MNTEPIASRPSGSYTCRFCGLSTPHAHELRVENAAKHAMPLIERLMRGYRHAANAIWQHLRPYAEPSKGGQK